MQNRPIVKRGFTLIELLVVIAIIALLAAILFPVFGRARENARRSSCASNLKQIGLGVMQYSQDYDERMPGIELWRAWHEAILPYTKSIQVYQCPSVLGDNTRYIDPVSGIYYTPKSIKNHYLGNGNNGAIGTAFNFRRPMDNVDPASTSTFKPTALAEIQAPAQCILVSEQDGLRVEPNVYSSGTNGGMDFTSHLQTSNFLFADGHVKSMKPTATYICDDAACNNPTNMWSVTPSTLSDRTPLRTALAAKTAAMQ
jgi:prepilin-type N-terminal cleavage/methylation domain-containing protein/prepilin-type processing-associated H-X9-DG protein